MDKPPPMTSVQKRALWAAWLGWGFDGLDSYLFIAVAPELVGKLVRAADPARAAAALNDTAIAKALTADITWKATLIQAVFFIGWALGGAVFGRLGDRLGRTKVLCLTVLTYAVFTGMGYFATEWWHLLVFRFLAALGIGGEWAAGSALVCETLDKRHRAWASAFLQCAYVLGVIAAVACAKFFRQEDRVQSIFLIGVTPALLVLWIRAKVPEPETWHAAAKRRVPRVTELFTGEMAARTLTLTSFIALALAAVWVFLFFMPFVVTSVPSVAALTKPEQVDAKTNCQLFFLSVSLAANFGATYTARALGPRRAFFIFCSVAMCAGLILFARQPQTLAEAYLGSACMACGLGMFAIFPLYVPLLFPTMLRTLGSGFAYNVGRFVTAGGTLVAGAIAVQPGGPSAAIWYAALLYVPMMLLCFVLPVTPAKEIE